MCAKREWEKSLEMEGRMAHSRSDKEDRVGKVDGRKNGRTILMYIVNEF